MVFFHHENPRNMTQAKPKYNGHVYISGVDTDKLENLADEEYDEEVVEFLLKVEEINLDGE